MSKQKKNLQEIHRKNAKAALAEAKLRRERAQHNQQLPTEVGSRRTIEPTRYGDWERKGITSDF